MKVFMNTRHDSEVEHGDDITQDNTSQDGITHDYPDDIKPEESQEWEPPPGWCWACWFIKPDTCDNSSLI